MLEQLKNLIRLQTLENKKAGLIRSRDETPRRMLALQKEFERFETEYVAKKAEFEHVKKMHRLLEQEVGELETKIMRSKTRMNEVKTNKEYQAIIKEIDDLRREIAKKEDRLLELMETIEAQAGEVKALEKDVQSRKKQLEQDIEKLQTQSEEVNERLSLLESLQREVRERLEGDLLKRCDFLIKNRGGIAVAPVQGGVCQICHLNIPPQKFIELQRDEAILNCPHCLRFIYWPGHEAYQIFDEELEEARQES